ncbi:hypothetical protein PMAYCL1PPCAC_22170 [Pristionchus mayeri]|uniref:Uncharacterized protein n=1 Tax=Pristionchus mayeri TaxID=1317129 RepID=A0AAN5I5D8_9BILA|nr:hypothetical protein PMAYCL1PPCAC_22170 [Pristionchus mayeri]
MVVETGYPPRPLTNDEKNQMVEYERDVEQWQIDLYHNILGQGPNPTFPTMPCFCHCCGGGNSATGIIGLATTITASVLFALRL